MLLRFKSIQCDVKESLLGSFWRRFLHSKKETQEKEVSFPFQILLYLDAMPENAASTSHYPARGHSQ